MVYKAEVSSLEGVKLLVSYLKVVLIELMIFVIHVSRT